MVRRTLKFLHTMGAIGLLGAMVCLVVESSVLPVPAKALSGYAAVREAMSAVCTWVLLPAMAVCLLSGLLAIAVTRGFHNAGWAWIKLISGILVFEGVLQDIQAPMRDEAERSAAALAGHLDPAKLAASVGAERGTIWVLAAVAVANVVLGIWRPRLLRLPD